MDRMIAGEDSIKHAFRIAYDFMSQHNKLCIDADDYSKVLKDARAECDRLSPEHVLAKNLLFAVAVSILDLSGITAETEGRTK